MWHRGVGAVGSALCTPQGAQDRIPRQGRAVTIPGITSAGSPEKRCCVLGQEQGRVRNSPVGLKISLGGWAEGKWGWEERHGKEEPQSSFTQSGLVYSGYLG